MNRIRNLLNKLFPSFRDDRGLSTVEYTIILVLIAAAGIALWQAFGDELAGRISGATKQLEDMEQPTGENGDSRGQ